MYGMKQCLLINEEKDERTF